MTAICRRQATVTYEPGYSDTQGRTLAFAALKDVIYLRRLRHNLKNLHTLVIEKKLFHFQQPQVEEYSHHHRADVCSCFCPVLSIGWTSARWLLLDKALETLS